MVKHKLQTTSIYCLGIIVFFTLYSTSSWSFTLDDVARQAKLIADKSYRSPKSNLCSFLRDMKYIDYQQIKFNHNKAYWNNINTPFKIEFYHQGMYFDIPVIINEITATSIHKIKYNSSYFNFGNISYNIHSIKNLGFAGFKVLYPINSKNRNDEVFSMLGASYFRVIGSGQVYGLSARGLAIDTALSSGEEFPCFREFWIKRPNPKDKYLSIYALLDSPRATGAYHFTIVPGHNTIVYIQSKIYLRNKVGKLGIAPLTSMFLFGSNQPSVKINYRPELHDSNGLLILSDNDEWIWRPLNNPKHLAISSFTINNPKGFGLLQRGRQFSRFEDLYNRYDLRPSGWVTPQGQWGYGKIDLVEIPTNDETNDNIVAYWTPDKLPEVGKEINFRYKITFCCEEDKLHAPNSVYVLQTRRSTGDSTQSNLNYQSDGTITFIIDFSSQNIKELPTNTKISAQTSINDNGEIIENNVHYNDVTNGWRLTLRIKIKDIKQVTEIRATLINNDHPFSETWSYQLPANE